MCTRARACVVQCGVWLVGCVVCTLALQSHGMAWNRTNKPYHVMLGFTALFTHYNYPPHFEDLTQLKLQGAFVPIVYIACAPPQNPFLSQPLDTRTTGERSFKDLTGSPHRGCVWRHCQHVASTSKHA